MYSFETAYLIQWSTASIFVTECWDLTIVNSSLLMIECKFAFEQERFELNTTESTTDRSFLLKRLDEHDSRVSILAHSASLSAKPAGFETRERAQKRRWCYDHELEFFVKDVTMCILYSLVACCGSKPQHCTLLRQLTWFSDLRHRSS